MSFNLEPHVCRLCSGRILSKPLENEDREYVCAICGNTAQGDSPKLICACGYHLAGRLVWKCAKNTETAPGMPLYIVVRR